MPGCIPDEVCGTDVDDLFAYKTPMLVAIKDRRLGLLKMIFMVLIVIYVFLITMIMNTGYLYKESPTGTVRFSLRAPTNNFGCDPIEESSCSQTFPPANSTYYCMEDLTPVSGCGSGQYRMDGAGCARKRNCTQRDALELSDVSDRSLLISTRLRRTLQDNNCYDRFDQCDSKLFNTTEDLDGYILGVEDYTLLIDHAVTGSSRIETADVSHNMDGRLKIDSEKFCKELADGGEYEILDKNDDKTSKSPCFLDPANSLANGKDVLPLGIWLAAADISLDGPSERASESIRARGSIVIIDIKYTNVKPWTYSSEITYEYDVRAVDEAKFNVLVADNVYDPSTVELLSRVVKKQYGIKFVVIQTGVLGEFDFNTFLLQLAAGMALLGIAKTFTDFLALTVMPEREIYQAAKVQNTEDFSDLRKRRKQEKRERKAQQDVLPVADESSELSNQ